MKILDEAWTIGTGKRAKHAGEPCFVIDWNKVRATMGAEEKLGDELPRQGGRNKDRYRLGLYALYLPSPWDLYERTKAPLRATKTEDEAHEIASAAVAAYRPTKDELERARFKEAPPRGCRFEGMKTLAVLRGLWPIPEESAVSRAVHAARVRESVYENVPGLDDLVLARKASLAELG